MPITIRATITTKIASKMNAVVISSVSEIEVRPELPGLRALDGAKATWPTVAVLPDGCAAMLADIEPDADSGLHPFDDVGVLWITGLNPSLGLVHDGPEPDTRPVQ